MSPCPCACVHGRESSWGAVAPSPALARYPSVGRPGRAAGPHHVLVLLGRQVSPARVASRLPARRASSSSEIHVPCTRATRTSAGRRLGVAVAPAGLRGRFVRSFFFFCSAGVHVLDG